MMRLTASCLLVALATGAAARAVDKVSPVQKVIELLAENKAKVVQDLAAEEKEMVEYASFCDSENDEKGYAITTATRTIGDLTAKIEDSTSQVAAMEDDVAATSTEVAGKEKQMAEAAAVRAEQKANFQAAEQELELEIDELESAVAEIKHGSGGDFLQLKSAVRGAPKKHNTNVKFALTALSRLVDAAWVNTNSRRKIQGLLQSATAVGAAASAGEAEEDGDDLNLHEAPKAAAFESATGGIMKILEEMKGKAEEALSDARSTEMNQEHQKQMMAQSLTNGIEAGKEKLASLKENIAEATETLGKARSELVETQKNKAADEQYVATLNSECASTKEEWAARQEDARAEMAALDKAKEILAERVKVFVQGGSRIRTTAATATARNDGSDLAGAEGSTRNRVVAKLKSLSNKFNSFSLMEMVNAAAADPFEKVRGLIENMVAKLVAEANEEATQKAFCDEETAKSKDSQSEKTMTIDKLKARLDTAAAKKAELLDNIKELEGEIAALDKGMKEATDIRQQEHATNTKAAADNKEAADAVEQAIMVLKEYYEGVGLIQKRSVSGAPQFGGNKGDAAASILSILEMCGEDFTKMYMEIEQAEAEGDAAYKKMMQESKVSRTSKAAEVKGAESEIKSLAVAIKNHQEDYDMTSQELDAVVAYLDKLKPQCESKAMSYQERKSRREAEVEGLKEALTILTGE